MIKIKRFLSNGLYRKKEDVVEIDEDEWNSMSKDEQDNYLDDLANEFRDNHLDFGAYVIDD